MRRSTRTTALLILGLVAAACSSSNDAKPAKLCTPGAYVYCRCQDREEGTKLCNETGTAFGACEPCESATNPEVPDPGSSSSSSSGWVPPPDGGPPKADCGDGIVEAGEDCDDRNTDNADGCDTRCKLAGFDPPQTVACPGLEVHVWGGTHEPTIAGSTVGSGNRATTTTCTNQTGNSTTGGGASDRVFSVVAHATGTLTVAATDVNYDAFLYASETCASTGDVTTLACVNGANGTAVETLRFPVDAGKTYAVFVDGAGVGAGTTGNFRVTFSIR